MRGKVFSALNTTPITSLAPGGVHPGGSVVGTPSARPFVIYRMGEDFADLRGDDEEAAVSQTLQVWIYDDVGSYTRIESLLAVVKTVLGNVSSLRCTWQGNSPELSDDQMKAIVKYATFEIGNRP